MSGLGDGAMDDRATAIVTGDGEGERLLRGYLRADLPQLSVTELHFDPGFVVDQHTHADHVDSFYVLEGEMEFLLEDGPRLGGPGTLVVVPPGVVHGFSIPGPDPVRVLNMHTPDAGWAARLSRP